MPISKVTSPDAHSTSETIREIIQDFSLYSEETTVFSDGSVVMEFLEDDESEIRKFSVSPQGVLTDYQIIDVHNDTVLSVNDGHGDYLWSAIRNRDVKTVN